MTIGDRIRNKRLEKGMSVDDLAEKIGKNRATVYRYENGDIENFPTTILEPVAKALGTTPAYLIGAEENLSVDTDFIAVMFKDANLLSHIKQLVSFEESERKTIYDMIEFIEKKKGL